MPEVQDLLGQPFALAELERRRVLDHVCGALFTGRARSTFLGRYELERPVGRGAMGTVYAARDPQLRRRVALKIVRSASVDAVDRACREARALAAVTHPNVAAVFDVGLTDEDGLWIAMELVEGERLDRWSSRPRPWRDVARLFAQLADGLHAVHAAGLLHRDVKPANVIVRAGDVPVLVDFGVARSDPTLMTPQSSPVGEFGSTSAAAGTPLYLAPEQHEGGVASSRTDQYALCLTLLEVLTQGRVLRDVVPAQLRALKAAERFDSSAVESSRLRRILLRGLAADPHRRWPSLARLAQQLRHVADPPRHVWAVAVAAGACAAALLAWPATPCRAPTLKISGDVSERVSIRLGDFRRQWRAAYEEACPPPSTAAATERERDRVVSCLAHLRKQHDALVGALDHVDEARIHVIEAALVGLDHPKRCADLSAPNFAPAPGTPAAEIDAELSFAQALDLGGDGETARALALEQLARAERLQDSLVLARVLRQLGEIEVRAQRCSDAREHLDRAFFAASAAGDDGLTVHIGSRLAATAGDCSADLDDARQWLMHTAAVVQRLPADTEAEAIYLNAKGRIASRAGDPEEAIAAYRDSVRITAAVRGPDALQLAAPLGNLGSALLDVDETEESVRLNRRALGILVAAVGPDHPMALGGRMNVGNSLMRSGDLGGAQREYEAARRGFSESFGPHHALVADCATNLGIVLLERGQAELAVSTLTEAVSVHEAAYGAEDWRVAVTLYALGDALRSLGRRDDARRAHERALRIREVNLPIDHPDTVASRTRVASLEGTSPTAAPHSAP